MKRRSAEVIAAEARRELVLMIEAIANEKELSEREVIQAVEAAIVASYKEALGPHATLECKVNRSTGEHHVQRSWTVETDEAVEAARNVDEDAEAEAVEAQPNAELITIQEAKDQELATDPSVGDTLRQIVNDRDGGRIGARMSKHQLFQKLREAKRMRVAAHYAAKVGHLVVGMVKRRTAEGNYIISISEGIDALLLNRDCLQHDQPYVNDRVTAVLTSVDAGNKGPQLHLSRTSPMMLTALMRREVPEIAEDVVEIKAAARDPGMRAKVAVSTNDRRIDAVGACVGMRGKRVQTVQSELGGEKIEIVHWDADPTVFVQRALEPAKDIKSISLNYDDTVIRIGLPEDQLPLAIGKSGSNVRMAVELTGWRIDLMSEEEAKTKSVDEKNSARDIFMEELELDADSADVLYQSGAVSLEHLARMSPPMLSANIPEIDEEFAEELIHDAKRAIIVRAGREEKRFTDRFGSLDGISVRVARQLEEAGLENANAIADLAADELMEKIKGLDEELAQRLIMSARNLH